MKAAPKLQIILLCTQKEKHVIVETGDVTEKEGEEGRGEGGLNICASPRLKLSNAERGRKK